MKKSTERSAQIISARNTTQKNKRHDDYHKNQNIMLRKKNIIDISTDKIQKKQKCVFSYNAQILK